MLATGMDPLAHGAVPPFDLARHPGGDARPPARGLPVGRDRPDHRAARSGGSWSRASGFLAARRPPDGARSRCSCSWSSLASIVAALGAGGLTWTSSSSRSRSSSSSLGAELFTNGIEWFGRKLDLAEGAVGSVLAAVGTALPETMIPIIAILFGGGGEATDEVGVGAILGAPFMLSTLAMFVTGVGRHLPGAARRATGTRMVVDTTVLVPRHPLLRGRLRARHRRRLPAARAERARSSSWPRSCSASTPGT